ncbi:MAG: hypothetical protein KatS3mg068_2142 [Candidatus Sericytochromatia bacterium]|nr:MAG: hypothetical protein KatS3mg068_2142 [Candidatus Sericytochromatia bacterium]
MNKILKNLLISFILIFIFIIDSNSLEYWQFLETRVKIAKDKVDFLPESLRFISGIRFDERYPGLGLVNFRMGPLFKISDNILLGLSISSYAEQIRPKFFGQQYRLEFEPNFNFNLQSVSLNNRSRLEYRFLNYDDYRNSIRFRNQIRLNYNSNNHFIIYAWDDIFFELLNNPKFNQNRFSIGIGIWLDKSSR